MSRAKGSRKPCDQRQARQRLVDARQFLEAAEFLESADVVATNAIHAAIAAADAITCSALGERSAGGSHGDAVAVLRQVDAGLSAVLKRALDRKTQAAYESEDVSAAVATNCVKWARRLVAEANARLEA